LFADGQLEVDFWGDGNNGIAYFTDPIYPCRLLEKQEPEPWS
jgi:hypothetical protein